VDGPFDTKVEANAVLKEYGGINLVANGYQISKIKCRFEFVKTIRYS
jgi:hypothetical protein